MGIGILKHAYILITYCNYYYHCVCAYIRIVTFIIASCRIYIAIHAINTTLVVTDLLSCSIGLSWVNFVSPMGLGCRCSWWWLSILGSPDTAALGWCGPRWNPTAMPSSNSSASTAPLMVYYNKIYRASLSLRPRLHRILVLVVYGLYRVSSSCVHTTGHFFFISILFHFIIRLTE